MDYRVHPLALPPLRQGERPLGAMVEGYDAISLFVEQAATARRGFARLDQNAPPVTGALLAPGLPRYALCISR